MMAAVNSWVLALTVFSLLVYGLFTPIAGILDWDEQDGL